MNEALQALRYDPETGDLLWAHSKRSDRIGKVAGSIDSHGYRQIRIGGRLVFAHRVAFFMIHGHWPAHDVDHINGDRLDNRPTNLREADDSQNAANRATKPGALPKGVTAFGKRFGAAVQYRTNGRKVRRHLGMFATPEEAGAAYRLAARARWGEFARN